jgi:hypothetical protein
MYDRSGTEETLKVVSELTQQENARMEQMIPASEFSGLKFDGMIFYLLMTFLYSNHQILYSWKSKTHFIFH